MVIANMSREGGSLASRLEYDPTNKTALQTEFRRILDMLMSASSGLNMAADGKIYISRITAGTSKALPDRPVQENRGSLVGAATSVTTPGAKFGLPTLYKYLDYGGVVPSTAVIGEVTVVEVFYEYTPITPIGKFIPGLLTGSGAIIASKAVFN
jgi:hypothetical protein